jgi:hypothetical protein
MKKPPSSPEFARFTAALGDIVKVSPEEMARRIADHEEKGKRLPKGASLGSAASSKIRSSFGGS